MKRVAVILLTGLLAACGSTSKYQQAQETARKDRIKTQEQVVDKAPIWFTDPPVGEGIVYATGTFASTNWDLANRTAMDLALGKICTKLGGQVNQQSRVFQREVNGRTQEFSETAIKNLCPRVNVAGFEVAEREQFTDRNGRIRVYVLIAYNMDNPHSPTNRDVESNANRAFQDLDQAVKANSR